MVLPEGLLTFAADYGAVQADRGHGAGDVDLAAADGQNLADPAGGAERRLVHRAELAIGLWAGRSLAAAEAS